MDKMEDAKYLDLIAKYLSGNITPPEREELFAWLESSEANEKFFDQMIQLWGISTEYEEEPFEADLEKAWDRLETRLPGAGQTGTAGGSATDKQEDDLPSGKIRRLSNRRYWLRYAAVILLLISIGGWWLYDPLEWRVVVRQTAEGESGVQVTLPDSTVVWLNEGTTLAYREPFWLRKVELEGEAFFEVTNDGFRKFTILTEDSRTTVLGTSFNVRAYPGKDVEVTVKTGKVRLEDRKDRSELVELDPKQSGVVSQETGEAVKKEREIVNSDSWKTKELSFDNTPIKETIESLERYYDVKIMIDEAFYSCDPVRWSERDPDLEYALEVVLDFMKGATIERVDEKTIRITGKGCQ